MKGSSIKPLFSYVLIKPLEEEKKTSSGILLPDSATEKPQMGEIMAVGTGSSATEDDCCGGGCGGDECCGAGEKKSKMVVKKGQKVLYKKWVGNELKVDGAELLLVEQKDIMAIVE